MTNELKIKISADLDDLKKGLNQADDAVDKFSTTAGKSASVASSAMDKVSASANKMSNSIELSKSQVEAWDEAARRNTLEQYDESLRKVGTRADGTTGKLRILNRELKLVDQSAMKFSFGVGANPQLLPKATKNFDDLTKGIRGTNTVAIEFSRIVQDAPYGIIGVGNNITQLTQSFANLRAQTGSTSQALKIAFSSLLSGTNLLVLGISAVTTAFTVYSMWARKNKKDTDDTKDALQEYITALRDYVQAQDAVSRARTKGIQDSAREISTLRALYAVATDTTVAIDKRREAVDSLQKEYPRYFGNLKDEVILTGQAEAAYRRLTQEILASGKARAAIKLQADAYEELAAIDLRRIGRAEKIAALEEKLGAIRERISKFEAGQSAERAGLLEEGIRLEKNLNDLKKQRTDDGTREIKLYQDINNLQKSIIANVKAGGSIVDPSTDATKKNNERKTEAEKLAESLIKNEERVQVAIREGRDKELEEARIRYENLYSAAKGNSEAMIQLAAQEADEVAAINRKHDQKALDEALKWEKRKWDSILKAVEKGAKDREKIEADARKKRERAEKELAKRIYEENLYYSQQIGNAVGNALEDALGRGENFFKALRDEFKRTLIRMAADAAAAQIGKAIMSGISSSGGGGGGGFWGFLGSALGWAGKLFGGNRSSSGSFPTGNYGGGNFPSTNPIRGGGFSPGIQSSAPTNNSNGVSVLRGTDIYMSNSRTIRLINRFNGGQ